MKCLGKKELTLFYYQDLLPPQKEAIANHLGQCPRCQAAFTKVKALLDQIKINVAISQDDLARTLSYVENKALAEEAGIRDKTSLWQQFLKPQLAAIVVVLFVTWGMISFYAGRRHSGKKDLAILEIEMELSLENSAESLFDAYEDNFFLEEELMDAEYLKTHHASYRNT